MSDLPPPTIDDRYDRINLRRSRPALTEVRFEVPGVPPAWTNERGHRMQIHSQMRVWKSTTIMLAQSARNTAGWPPLDRVEPAMRWVKFELYRHRLLDADNAATSIKPILDGLKRVLIVDDSERWLGWLGVEQHNAPLTAPERVVITVWLVDPR